MVSTKNGPDEGEGRISKNFIPIYERSEHTMSPPVNFAVGITSGVEFEGSEENKFQKSKMTA